MLLWRQTVVSRRRQSMGKPVARCHVAVVVESGAWTGNTWLIPRFSARKQIIRCQVFIIVVIHEASSCYLGAVAPFIAVRSSAAESHPSFPSWTPTGTAIVRFSHLTIVATANVRQPWGGAEQCTGPCGRCVGGPATSTVERPGGSGDSMPP